MNKVFECILPFPPSVNAIWRSSGGRYNKVFRSKKYREWEKSCPPLILAEGGMIDAPCHVVYRFYLPDKRKRDLSNFVKAPEDYLLSQCVLEDDNHTIVQQLIVKLGGIDRKYPRVEIEIWR